MMCEDSKIDGQYAAKYFKYKMQFKLGYITQKLDFNRVFAKSFYCKYKKHFDRLVKVTDECNVDVLQYIAFFVDDYGKLDRDIPEKLCDPAIFNAYISHVKSQKKLHGIYDVVLRSAQNIARDCVELRCPSAKEYVLQMFKHKNLAAYYLTGKISRYWFAAIPSFKKLIFKLDQMSREEFHDVESMFDIYSKDVNDAFVMMTSRKVNVFHLTDELISKMRASASR